MSKANQLFQAIRGGNFTQVETLIKLGVDLNIQEGAQVGYTPLSAAIEKDNYAILKLLLDHGASVEATSNFSKLTVLHKAVQQGKNELVDLLIDNGPDVDRPIKLSIALEAAQKYNKTSLATFLKTQGACLLPSSPELSDRLINIINQGQITQLKQEIARIDPNIHDQYGSSLLRKEFFSKSDKSLDMCSSS